MTPQTKVTAIRNVGFVGGLGMVSTGLWWERPSLALIVPAVLLLAMLVFGSLTRRIN
jgi:hypothetical protein